MGARTVDIQLDRPRRLKLDFNALADFEEAGGDLLAMQGGHGGFHGSRLLLWAGLKWNDRSMTPQLAGELLGEYFTGDGSPEDLAKILSEALVKSGLGKTDAEQEAEASGEAETPEESSSDQ